jgi:capsular exopolysaccharide synthesis family protein
VEARLDSAREQLTRSAASIRAFKQSPGYTNLSIQEQNLVTRVQALDEQMRSAGRSAARALADVEAELRVKGPGQADLAAVIAKLPESANPRGPAAHRADPDEAHGAALAAHRAAAGQRPPPRALRAERARVPRRAAARGGTGEHPRARGQIGEQQAEGDRIRQERRQFPDLQNQLQGLEEQRTIDQETFGFLQSQLYQAQITRAAIGPYVEIIDPSTSATRIDPRGRMNVVLGALLGIILGVGAAFFLEYLDRTVRTSSDIETLLGIPVLGIIPRLRRLGAGDEEAAPQTSQSIPLLVALDPLDPAAEAYRNLRMNLMFMSTEEEPIRSVLFTSPGPGEGKSTTTVNFAVMLAQQGQRVLLIDADLRRPSLHRSLDLLREPGLTNLLVGDATVREAIRPSVLPNLDVLPSGPFPPNPSELLNSKAMKRLLEEFEGRYSQVIVDSPPMLAVTDGAVLAQHTDGVVLVLRSGETEQRAAERSVDQLRRLNVRVFGAVLNEVATTTTEESYYLQYYYAYQPRQEAPEEQGWARSERGSRERASGRTVRGSGIT